MAIIRGRRLFLIFSSEGGDYSREAINRGAAIIRGNTVLHKMLIFGYVKTESRWKKNSCTTFWCKKTFLHSPKAKKKFLTRQNCPTPLPLKNKMVHPLSQRHTWRFHTPIAANLIASKNRKRFSPPIDADTLGDFFRRSRRCGSFENSCDKIAQPDGLAFLAIRSNKRRKSWERERERTGTNLITDI